MSAHLLPVSAEWLARLPDGLLLVLHPTDGLARLDAVTRRRTLPTSLVLDDTVTAAAVAARIVGPWLDTKPDARAGRSVTGGRSEAQAITEAARRMEPLTPDQIETLARLARAAMEER